jgi:monovalent cation/hydrogen antiporter
MDTVSLVLVLLLAVALSGFCRCVLPKAIKIDPPLPLIQIVIGFCLSAPVFGLQLKFDPSIFMALFIPPLLFADGWRIPKREFFRHHRAILMLTLGLVLVTVVTLGCFLHALVSGMPLAVAFALAAVLAPTDAVAFGAILGRHNAPHWFVHVLNGEALMNDASGLIAFKFAVAAIMTGVFSLQTALTTFVIVAIGGLAVGASISWLAIRFTVRVFMQVQSDDPSAGVILTLLIPFAAYLAAESLGVSGVLSAVSAGMVMNYESLRVDIPTDIRVRMKSTWAMVEFVLNGMVFVLLGLQFPHIIGHTIVGNGGIWKIVQSVGYVAAVLTALYAIRFTWIWLTQWINDRRRANERVMTAQTRLRINLLLTIGGVRGAVTLAGILALPLSLPSGAPLETRDLAIFIASGSILGSLLVAVAGIPPLLRNLGHVGETHDAEEHTARRKATNAAIRAMNAAYEGLTIQLEATQCGRCADTNARVINLYLERLEALGVDQSTRVPARTSEQLEARLKLVAFQAERSELLSLRNAEDINDETFNKLIHEIDLSETALTTRLHGVRL